MLRHFTVLVVSIFIMYNVALDIALQYYVEKKTNKFSFIEEKVSKARHMKLQDNAYNFDYIFIGSSRTIYHVSTQQFKDKGLQIYNFGVSNRTLEDFPYMLKEAVSLKPKNIVISIEISSLFRAGMGHYDSVTLEDLKYIFEYKGVFEFTHALQRYIISKHLLFKHSEPIHIRLGQLYIKFNPKEKDQKLVVANENNNNFNLEADCNIFDYNYISKLKIVSKCTNGDGVLFGNTITTVKRTDNFDRLNGTYIKMLNALLGNVKANGIEPIVILEPVYKQDYNYNLSTIQANIDGKVIDLTKMSIADENWADDKHLNVNGRKLYTNRLVDALKK